jgi:hypothetical protein
VRLELRSSSKILGSDPDLQFNKGTIDAAEWVGPWNDLAFGLYREAPYYYGPSFHEPGPALAIGINRGVWDSLDTTEQAVIRAACKAANNDNLGEFTHNNALALKTLVDDHGVQLRDFSDEIWREIGRAELAERLERPRREGRARNVILFIVDGMGLSTVTAGRIFEGQMQGGMGEDHYLPFERWGHSATVKTYTDNAQVADSAATATALQTGIKTHNGGISIYPRQTLETCAPGATPVYAPSAASGMTTHWSRAGLGG